jgi:lysophospholipase
MWVFETKAMSPKATVVIVHGAGEHHGRYQWLSEKWLANGYHVIMGDLPGQGELPELRGHVDSFDNYIDTVRLWVERAATFQLPIILFGHSLGGLAVIRTLQEHACRPDLVVLSSPCLGLTVPPPNWLTGLLRPLNKWAPTFRVPVKKSADNRLATRNKVILEKDAKDPYINKKVSVRWYFELEKGMKEAFTKKHNFPDIPTFILQAGDDRIVNKKAVSDWFQAIPVKEKYYKEWPGLYHEVFNEPEREEVFHFLLNQLGPYID